MGNKVRVVQIGTGKMAKYTIKYIIEKGGEVVGAVDINPNVIGKDIGEIMASEKQSVVVEPLESLAESLQRTKPDIAIVTTMSLISDVEDALTLCAELGINAITTCEEAFYPMNSSPRITKELDEICKNTNCTITGNYHSHAGNSTVCSV